MVTIKVALLGLLSIPIRPFIRIKKNVWVFGSDKGRKFSQNSKYLYEYMLKEHPEIRCYWLTMSPDAVTEMESAGYPVVRNDTIKGMLLAISAKYVISSTWLNDITFSFYNKRQLFVYLQHGMPAKKIFYDLPSPSDISFLLKIKIFFSRLLVYDLVLEQVSMIPVTSSYFASIMKQASRNRNCFVLGQPRTDAFYSFNKHLLKTKYGFSDKDYIVTYMPTHRAYGKGEPSPRIFSNNSEAIDFFDNHNIAVIWKQHINMLEKYSNEKISSTCFHDLSFEKEVDSQELLYISDILITDYSSCFIDFMFLGRPVIFFDYDNYSETDNDTYCTSDDLKEIGPIVYNEQDLLKAIKETFALKDFHYPLSLINKYHQYVDNKSCERVYQYLINA